jgi:ABC-2 type transport system ATP-binding protein
MANLAIDVEDLRKVYPTKSGNTARALDGVSFQVEAGRIYGLLGPNGAGKSTTVKILGTVTPPSTGRATVFGHDVVKEPLEVRRRMTVVLQQTAAENLLTVEDNLLVYAYLHGVSPRAAKQRLKGVAEEFEIDARMRDTVQELSLGTKRRIQVAKIFMLDAPLIILD